MPGNLTPHIERIAKSLRDSLDGLHRVLDCLDGGIDCGAGRLSRFGDLQFQLLQLVGELGLRRVHLLPNQFGVVPHGNCSLNFSGLEI